MTLDELIAHCEQHRDNPRFRDDLVHSTRWESAIRAVRGAADGLSLAEAQEYAIRKGWAPWRPVWDWLRAAAVPDEMSSPATVSPDPPCVWDDYPGKYDDDPRTAVERMRESDDDYERELVAEFDKCVAWAATLDPELVKWIDVTVAGAEPTGRFRGQEYIDTFMINPDMPRMLEECKSEWQHLVETYVPTPVPVPSAVIKGPMETLVAEQTFGPNGESDRSACLLIYLNGWDSGIAGAEHDTYIIRDRLGVRGEFQFEFRRLDESEWHAAPLGGKPSRFRGDPEQAWYYLTGCLLPRCACEVRWGFRRWHATQSDSPRVQHDGPWESLGEFTVGLSAGDAHDWVVNRCQDAQPHQPREDIPEPHIPLQYLGRPDGDLTDERSAEWAADRERRERESDERDLAWRAEVQSGIEEERVR